MGKDLVIIMKNKLCVYTVLIGNYELLNEQPTAESSLVDFLCFTDNPKLVSQSWKIVHVEPVLPLDDARSSRFLKLRPHHLLKDYTTSLYIDNSIVLKKKPEDIYNELMSTKNVDMVCLKHSYRETVLDEFIEVSLLQLDDLNTIMEQLTAYSISAPEVLHEKPFKGCFLLRNHHEQSLADTMDEWLAHVLRFSRRDQLSMNYVLRKNKLKYDALDMDIFNSAYFTWPVVNERNREKNISTANLSSFLMDRIIQGERAIRSLRNQVEQKEQTIQNLNIHLTELTKGRAWKLIQQYRHFRAWVGL